jgi:hypothetical protein
MPQFAPVDVASMERAADRVLEHPIDTTCSEDTQCQAEALPPRQDIGNARPPQSLLIATATQPR